MRTLWKCLGRFIGRTMFVLAWAVVPGLLWAALCGPFEGAPHWAGIGLRVCLAFLGIVWAMGLFRGIGAMIIPACESVIGGEER